MTNSKSNQVVPKGFKAFPSCMRLINECFRTNTMKDIKSSMEYSLLSDVDRKFIDQVIKSTELQVLPECVDYQCIPRVETYTENGIAIEFEEA